MAVYFVVVLIVLLTATGDYFLKLASGKDAAMFTTEFGLGAACYMGSAIGIVYVMRYMSLAAIGVWYSVLTILFMAGLGVFVFKETLTPREMAGIVMAICSVGMMTRFA